MTDPDGSATSTVMPDATPSSADPSEPTIPAQPSDDPNGPGTPQDPSDTPSPAEPSPTNPDVPLDPTTPEAASAVDAVPPTSQVLRISGADLDRVFTDLLGLDVAVASNFPEEVPTLSGYFDSSALTVNDRFKTELTRSAEALAQQVVSNEQAYAFVVGCNPSDASCRDDFVENFISRAYRRPISESERNAYLGLFDSAAEWIQSGDDFADGVQLVIEAALQAPNFLYRIERGTGTEDDLGTVLTSHEVASRLSFMYWGTMPDAELFDAATSGTLLTTEGLQAQATRLASDPRVSTRVVDFHERWLQATDLDAVSKDPMLFPEFDAQLVDSMRQELRQFVHSVSLDGDGGIRELLTTPHSYVDARLAELYNLEGSFDDEFARVDFAADSPRAGLLTQAAFLTGHSSSARTTSPILRGVFVLARLTCFKVPEPPANATSAEPPEPATPPVTTRDLFTWKTSLSSCSTCHDMINPVGFAFEAFDAIGRHRTTENGAPIDSTGETTFPERFAFVDAKNFANQLAPLPETRACYATNWLEYAYGRKAANEDLRTLADLTSAFGQSEFGARDLLLRLTESAAFTHVQSQP